jgi:DNA-binding PadR family transcriptional regulator
MGDSASDPRQHLPLTALDLSILLALSEGVSYGYGIVKAVAAQSRGGIELAPGNLYQALDRLISRGWIREAAGAEVPAGSDGRRRYYAITTGGRRAVALEAKRLREMESSLERAIRLEPGRG